MAWLADQNGTVAINTNLVDVIEWVFVVRIDPPHPFVIAETVHSLYARIPFYGRHRMWTGKNGSRAEVTTNLGTLLSVQVIE